ncbi:MAG TPA: NADH-quinone oxidoreductase subunit NuoK [Syntrophales bacterium]|nr:NADH-quinone oxidoreductase subunit NuoK [Syntrophales bacterium]
MNGIPMAHGLVVASVLFALGITGVLIRRDILFILLSLEIMLNAAGLAFVVAGSRWLQPDGQLMFIFILAVAAAEVSLGLALILWMYSWHKTLDVDCASKMRG